MHFWELKFIDIIVPFLTLIALVIAYFQIIDIRKQKRIEFTYTLYRDFIHYINQSDNSDLKEWLFGCNQHRVDNNKVGDLLEHFEALWSLKRQGMINVEIAYDLFAYYILKAANTSKPSAFEYIENLKEVEKNSLGYRDDLYEGFLSILEDMKDMEYFKFQKAQ